MWFYLVLYDRRLNEKIKKLETAKNDNLNLTLKQATLLHYQSQKNGGIFTVETVKNSQISFSPKKTGIAHL